MKKCMVWIFCGVVLLVGCMSEDDGDTADDQSGDADSIVPAADDDVGETDDISSDTEEQDADDGSSGGGDAFCVSGDALVPEGSQRVVPCASAAQRLQVQHCVNGSWEDDEGCIDYMQVIHGGTFSMGCSVHAHDYCEDDAVPIHDVTLAAFAADVVEVTVREYEQCIDDGSCGNNGDVVHYRTADDSSYCNIGSDRRQSHPANCLTWHGAAAYCAWKGKRLPTEAEWEYIARGEDENIFPWGKQPLPDCDHAVMKQSSYGCDNGVTMPVGTTPAGVSPFGIYDLAGNVAEYVSDLYDPDYYATKEAAGPDPHGPADTDTGFRIVRGGAFTDTDRKLRSYFRASCEADDPAIGFGVRCVTGSTENLPN